MTNNNHNTVYAFSDGSAIGNPGPGGRAAVVKHPASGKAQTLTGGAADTTNNRMELIAPLEAMRSLKPGTRWKVQVVSDSEYLVRGMTEWMAGWIARGWLLDEVLTDPSLNTRGQLLGKAKAILSRDGQG